MKQVLLFRHAVCVLLLCAPPLAFSQNVAINGDGSRADPNAMLDIKSNNKGLLIPRLSTEARLSIPNTQGLMVYDINTNSFWYNTGKEWRNLSPASAEIMAATGPWLVTGNAGTDNTNFLGTRDNAPLNIRVNNQQSGRIDHLLNNTFWGFRSGFSITTGNDNTGIGASALFGLTTGYNNTAVGSNALQSNSTGHHNAAFGRFALISNITGYNNTAIGTGAMFRNISGKENTAIGSLALYSNIGVSVAFEGNYNTAVGSTSLASNVSGDANTAIGYFSLGANTTGRGNTAVGINTLTLNTSGGNNTAIGAAAEILGFGLTNATVIGAGAFVNASNKVRIGNTAVTVIEGQVPFTFPSDGRFKFQVQEDVKGLDFIMQLRPVTYRFDIKRFETSLQEKIPAGTISKLHSNSDRMEAAYEKASSIRRSGFIAQEVEEAAKKAGYNFSGVLKPEDTDDYYTMSYDAFVVPLVKAVQEQQQLIKQQQLLLQEQNKKIAEQQAINADNAKKLSALQKELDEIKKLLQK